MRFIPFLLLGAVVLFALTVAAGRLVNAQVYKIREKAGVQTSAFLPIGGLGQYIQIRGRDAANPILLVLHGGPGSSMADYSYQWQSFLEPYYTVVHWDQRGCGNTYYRDRNAEEPTLELLLKDLDELVDTLRRTYGKDKLLLMGHSWGTFLGGIYAGKHPEKLSAYIAVSQMLDLKKSEEVSAQEAIRLANLDGKTRQAQGISTMLADFLTCRTFGPPEAAALLRLRQRKEAYLPPQYGSSMGALRLFSPYMTFRGFIWMFSFKALIHANRALYEALLSGLSMYDYPLLFEVPVIIVAGERDWTTPFCMAQSYYRDISAPGKEFIALEDTGHIPFLDRPRAFSEALLKALAGL